MRRPFLLAAVGATVGALAAVVACGAFSAADPAPSADASAMDGPATDSPVVVVDGGGDACTPLEPARYDIDGGACELQRESAGPFVCPGANACSTCSGSCCYPQSGDEAKCNASAESCLGASNWACDGRATCSTGHCCIRAAPVFDSGSCPRPEGTGSSTTCDVAACVGVGVYQVCRNSTECPDGGRCTAFSTNPRGTPRTVGICATQ